LKEWAARTLPEGHLRVQIEKFCSKSKEFQKTYTHLEAPRTSNGVDRLMDYQDRQLYAMRYLHGGERSGQLAVRASALLWNFHPYQQKELLSPFAQLNDFYYHSDWLQNLMIAASLQRKWPSHKIR
jgi:hypothetical protein